MRKIPLPVFLAALPVLAFSLEARSGFFYGAVGGGSLLMAGLCFFLFSKIVPESCRSLFFWLLLGAVPLAALKIFGGGNPAPFLLTIVSLFILTSCHPETRPQGGAKDLSPEILRPAAFGGSPQNDVRHLISPAVFYWLLLTAHGLVTETLGYFLGLSFFQQPAGSFFLMGLAAALFGRPEEAA